MTLEGVRILLVDDYANSADLYQLVLEQLGATVTVAYSVGEALDAFDRALYDVVVSDISLPDGDGYDLLQTIRDHASKRGRSIPAIALTARAFPKDREAALAAGFAKHCPKPCTPNALAEAVAEVIEAAARSSDPGALLDGLRILVVDDYAADRYLIEKALSKQGAIVVAATSAGEAVEALDRETPDVLISDVKLPEGSGYDLMRHVRGLDPERGGRVPAVAVTILDSDEDRADALDAGFQEHIPKPFDPTQLVSIVAVLAGKSD